MELKKMESKEGDNCIHHSFSYGIYPGTVFRNDDVAFDSNLEHFKQLCAVFHKYGYVQLHAVTLFGKLNCSYIINGIPAMYDSINPYDIHIYSVCKSVSQEYYIGNNKELIVYLNSIPDPIALHGLYHSDYSEMSYDQQDADIKEGLRLLHELFPHKVVDTFVAPFNKTNEDTFRVCEKYGLRVSAVEGEHLEEMIHRNFGRIMPGQVYRYHHHRFYPETTFFYYKLDVLRLDQFLETHRFRRRRICILCDRPHWAHHNSAMEIQKQLSDEFDIDIRYVVDTPCLRKDDYDILLVLFWGENLYKSWNYPKEKLIKQVSSHRWEDDPHYGPVSAPEFVKKYLDDAGFAICPSRILFEEIKPWYENLYLCGKGFAPNKFYYKGKRSGSISLCMAGNVKDPVKGVQELLIPSAEGYHLDIADSLPHEKLCEFYNQHDLYVVSSKHEADPLPLIESMACGCYPVSSYVGIAPELIRHKENGYLVKERSKEAFREAFLWCEENIGFIRKKAEEIAQEIYEKRRWEIMAENYRRLFRTVLSNQPHFIED